MPLLNYILFLLPYHVNNKTLDPIEIVLRSGNLCVIKPRRTLTRAQRGHGSGIVHVLVVSKALSQISFSI